MIDISKVNDPAELVVANEAPGELTDIFRDYREYKMNLDAEIKANAEGFVRIGYLLKVARDTNILEESGYKNVAEFAQAEYGLTKDVVSRFIAINDRYSIDGYSDKLLEKYEGYGVAKLQEMLTLPDEIIEEITPSLTKREIQDIKREIAAEEAVTPLEVAIEAAAPEVAKDEKEYSPTERIWKEFFHENKDLYKALGKDPAFMAAFTEVRTDEIDKKAAQALLDILAPGGDTVLWSRVPGVGRIMISIHTDDGTIVYMNARTNEKTKAAASDAEGDIHEVFGECTAVDWGLVFYEPFEEKLVPAPEKKSDPAPAPAKTAKSAPSEMPSHKDAANRQQEDGHKAAVEEKPEVAPAQQSDEEVGMNPPEENPIREYRTRPLNSITDAKAGDRLINVKTGETADVLGYVIGDIKAATDHGIILVSAPNSIGWAILDEEPEKTEQTGEAAESEESEDAAGQQDEEEQEDDIRGLRNRIYDKEHEFEEVFEDAYADGFTPDGLKSITRQLHQLQVMIDKLLDYKLQHQNEESEGDDE